MSNTFLVVMLIIFLNVVSHSLLSIAETTLSLLRHPDYCISGYSSVSVTAIFELMFV